MTQRNQSKFVTSGGTEADDPLVQGPRFEMDGDDRQKIDNQIRGLQQHLVDHPSGASSDTAENVGDGADVFKEKSAGAFKFKRIQAGANVSITENEDEIVIDAEGGGDAEVADDIGKSGPTSIDRVLGIKGVALEPTDTLGVGDVWVKRGSTLRADRPVPKGHFDIRDYGDVGGGANAAIAFRNTLAAMGTNGLGQKKGGAIYLPPMPPTEGYEFKTADPNNTDSASLANAAVLIDRQVHIYGCGPRGGWDETQIICDDSISAFFASFAGPNRGAYARIENLYIWSSVNNRAARVPGATYEVGDQVRLFFDIEDTDDENAFYAECVVGGEASMSSTFDIFVTAPEVSSLLGDTYPDGDVEWQLKIHSGIVSQANITVRDCQIASFTGAGLFVAAGSGLWPDTSNANCFRADTINMGGCGLGVYVRGSDANSCIFNHVTSSGNGAGQTGNGGHGIFEGSFLGNKHDNLQVESGTGRGILVPGGPNAANVFHGEIEGSLRKNKINAVSVCTGLMANGAETSTFTRIGGPYDSQGIRTRDDVGAQGLTAALDTQDGLSVLQIVAETSDANRALQWQYNTTYIGGWSHRWASNSPAYGVTGKVSFPGWDPGFFRVPQGIIIGNVARGETFWFGTYDSLTFNNDVRGGARKRGDWFWKTEADVVPGCFAAVTPLDDDGGDGVAWEADTGYSAATTVASGNVVVIDDKVFRCTVSGVSDSAPPDVAGATDFGDLVTDNDVTWEYFADVPTYGGLKVESPHYEHAFQAVSIWKDSADTGTTAPKIYTLSRRRDTVTTDGTTAANQVLDDGVSFAGVDFTIPQDSVVTVNIDLEFKETATAEAGYASLSGTYVRNGSGNPVLLGAVDAPSPKLSAGLGGTTANLFINTTSKAIEVRMSPGAAKTLKTAIIRTHIVKTD